MARTRQNQGLPSRREILDWLKTNGAGAPRRDIARAFGVKGEARAELRRLLKELEAEGKIERAGRRVVQTEELAPVAPIDVMSVDEDGDLLCLPARWVGDAEPPMIRIPARRAARIRPPPGVGDRLLARLKPAGDDGYLAEIIKPIGKGAHRFLCVYRERRQGGLAEPVERRSRGGFSISPGDNAGAREGDLVWVETAGGRDGRYGAARARVREIAGHIDDKNAFSLMALAAHGVPTEFPASAIEEAERASPPGLENRVDLRDTPLITIDPEDARDHDDAVFAAPDDDPNNEGGFRVIVAIADVSFFVAPGGTLDREAQRRGNSVYLPDRVIPMLPERLSNDLCSLREGEDRACIAVEMKIAANGRKLSHRFMRAIMRSAAKLSYGDAQAISDGRKAPEDMRRTVNHLYTAFHARWKERQHRAPLDLDLPERRIVLNDAGEVARIERRERFDAHRLIEEFMILANIAAAETLEQRKTPRIYRVHDTPDQDRLEAVRKYLGDLGYSLVKGPSVRPAHFNQILKIAENRDEKEMVSEVVLRAQRQAVYATENLGHFGLNIPRYAHFTSPIRRYADLTVHRALVSALKLGPGGQTGVEAARLSKIAEEISDYERRAMAAERESQDRYLAAYLSDRVGAEFEARIRGVTRFGLFVMLDETGADGFVPMRTLGPERYRFVEERHAVIGERTGAMYRLGQPVRVALAEATPLTGGLRFDMVSEPIAGAAPGPAGAGKKKKQKGKRAAGGRKAGKARQPKRLRRGG